MSYGINIWSTEPLEAADARLQEAGFRSQEGGHYRFDGPAWQILLYGHRGVMPEDVPEQAMQIMPGIRFLSEINLEPVSAPKAAYTRLKQVARLVAGATSGVIEDMQEGSFALPGGKKRFAPPKREKEERFSILIMSWWFEGNRFEEKVGIAAFLELLKRYLPEALPRRYGLYEPPQFGYEEQGYDSFLEFLEEHKYDMIVWYTTRPVMTVGFNPVEESGFVQHGGTEKYRCGHLSISLDYSVLDDENWRRHLHHFWEACSHEIQPFFGDVRVLDNYISGRGTYYTDMKTQHHPVRSGWWAGIPREPGMAIVVGNPYLDLWPAVGEKSTRQEDLYFVSTEDWTAGSDVRTVTGEVPVDIAQADVPGWKPWQPDEAKGWLTRLLMKLGIKSKPEQTAWHFAHSEVLPKVFPFNR